MRVRKGQKIMAKRVALIPEELVSAYHLQKPEIRLEDDIDSLLERANLPNDMKAKLLSQLIMRYHKTMHAPPEPVPVSVTNEKSTDSPSEKQDTRTEEIDDKIYQSILLSTPKNYQKFIPMITEKLKTRQYAWNDKGEMTQDSSPIKGSSIVDFFSYTMRNSKHLEKPLFYNHFVNALREINIPRGWIGNPKVPVLIENPFHRLEDDTPKKKKKRRSKSADISSFYQSDFDSFGDNIKSESKWLNYPRK